jgi:hypothetical protein
MAKKNTEQDINNKLLIDALSTLLITKDKLQEHYTIKPTNPIYSMLTLLDLCEKELKGEILIK